MRNQNAPPKPVRVSNRRDEPEEHSDEETVVETEDPPPPPQRTKKASPSRKVEAAGPPVDDSLDRWMVSSEAPPQRTSTCVLLWLNPFEFLLTITMGILEYVMLLIYPESWVRAPATYWFLTVSIMFHIIVTTAKSYKERWILYNVILIVLDILMIVAMSIPDTWIRGNDSLAHTMQTDAVVALVLYIVLFICSFIRLILSLDHTCCLRCCNPPPRTRHRHI